MWRTSNSYCIAFLVINYSIQMLSISLKNKIFHFASRFPLTTIPNVVFALGPLFVINDHDHWSYELWQVSICPGCWGGLSPQQRPAVPSSMPMSSWFSSSLLSSFFPLVVAFFVAISSYPFIEAEWMVSGNYLLKVGNWCMCTVHVCLLYWLIGQTFNFLKFL